MFKNGYAFITREIPLKDGKAALVAVPPASLGTLWFWADKGSVDHVESATYAPKATGKPLAYGSFEKLLSENVGKRVSLTYASMAKSETLSGIIVAVGDQSVTIRTASGTRAILKGAILSVASADPDFKWTFTQTETRRYFRIVADARAGKVLMTSLERGITWAPAFAIEIEDASKLTLAARGTILNDLQDLNQVRGRFVTGFPNLPFRNVLDPLTAGMNLDQWLNFVGASGGGGGFAGQGGAMTQNAARPLPEFLAFDNSEAQQVRNESGETISDLFFYDLPTLSIKLGARRMETLFQAQAEYKDIYKWDVADAVVNNVEFRELPPGTAETPDDVWHTIRFRNSAKQPLTTAPVTIFRKGELIGQAMMNYVPAGAECEVQINKALDIRVEQSEEETGRERGAIKDRNGNAVFDLATVKATLVIRNQKASDVVMSIRKPFTGEAVAAEGDPKISKSIKGLRDVNPRGRFVWQVAVGAGQERTLTCTYKLYVRSQG